MKRWPISEDSTYRRRFCSRLALVLVYAALAIVFGMIGATVLFTLTALLTVAFAYEVLRFHFEYRRSDA